MKIVTAGDNCIDYYINSRQGFPGGNPVNVAVYLKRFIDDVSYIGYVGDDQFGSLMTASLEEKGVDISMVKVIPGGKTAVTQVELVGSERVFRSYNEGVHKAFTLDEKQLERCYSADAFVTGVWGRCEDYIERIHEHGVTTVFDFATKLDTPIFERIAPYVDYSFFSWEGEKNMDEIKAFMKRAVSMGTKCVVVTLGSDGSMAFDGVEYYKCGIFPCAVVDTMGAGDSFVAGFTYGIVKGKSIVESMSEGARNSTITIQYKGAW